MLKKKKVWDLIGMILGLVILIAGIVFAATPPESYSTDTAEYASFGGDFYTYEYDATRIAAKNTAVTANNLREMGEAMAKYFGFLFMAAGALTTVSYGKKFFVEDAEEAPQEELPAEITAEAVAADELAE